MGLQNFEVQLSSEYVGLINFLICEIVVMAYVMYASSVVAGALNYRQMIKGLTLELQVFGFPHIGGGLVMNKSFTRMLLIFIRLSTFIAVAISNYGLEGRTIVKTTHQEAEIRVPGPIEALSTAKLFDATERQMRCSQTVGDDLIFGSVINDHCFPDLSTNVRIQSIALGFENFNGTAQGCSIKTNTDYFHTVFKCQGMDLTCLGFYGPRNLSLIGRGLCTTVRYEKDYAWLCPVHSAIPGRTNVYMECRKLRAKKEDIDLWTDIYNIRTLDVEKAVFGSAYGRKQKKFLSVPTGERNITVVTLFWWIPALYEVFAMWVLTIWVIALYWKGAQVIAHDEAGLARLLSRRVDISGVETREWIETSISSTDSIARSDDII